MQSLVNLVESLRQEYTFYVVCSAYEMGESVKLTSVQSDVWNNYNDSTQVFYSTQLHYKQLLSIFNEIDPAIVYINGMFLPMYNWLPLYLAKQQRRKAVLAPRGMLQRGALSVKPFKKQVFLRLFKLSGLYKNMAWHATDEQERTDIRTLFGAEAAVQVALNIPKLPLQAWPERKKIKGQLSLVYLSLITEKKNLHLVLQALKQVAPPIRFDIYGPVKDNYYWERCQQLMQDQHHTINYCGSVSPLEVQSKLASYHALILPTKGENFGHAIYEALSAGTVPIISPHTPWGNLDEQHAGFTVDSWKEHDWANAVLKIADAEQADFNRMSQQAFGLANDYYKKNDFKSGYYKLFE